MKYIDKMISFLPTINYFIGKKLVIDCGHAPIFYDGERFFIGKNKPSETEILTLEMGLILKQYLENHGVCDIQLNICLSDTRKYIKDISARSVLRNLISEQTLPKFFPKDYSDLLLQYGYTEPPLITLQSKNSNLFTRQLKKVKKRIRSGDDAKNSFNNSKCIYLVSSDGNTFGFTNAFLFDCRTENSQMGGSWWLDESIEIHPSDLFNAPFLRIKKMKVINVYNKYSGILCPGSYCGLLQNFDNNYNHISIYCRKDDEAIGEKVLRGVISAFSFIDFFDRKCI
ncbi:hypothetical protein QUB60_17335 [Microcoleus sp. A2-C5]|uniref:hypothetical protein n=1 Tax=unclassified Microcoleus TaxID=2642155 RepID=UPI002FD5E976